MNGVNLAYEYDGLGRQVSRTQGASTRTDFWYDATGLSQTTGATAQTYLRDPGGLLLSVKAGSSLYNYGRDRLGSITGVTNASQSLVNDHRYDPWGQTLAPTTEAVGQPFRFTGGLRDATSGFHTFGQRHYAWSLGRFTQLDSLPASVLDINRHTYAGCNPTSFVDRSGTQACALFAAEAGLLAAGFLIAGPVGVAVAVLGGATVGSLSLAFGVATGDIPGSVLAVIGLLSLAAAAGPPIALGILGGIAAFGLAYSFTQCLDEAF